MVYVLLGTGFEEMEAIAPIDLMRRAGIEVLTVGVTRKTVYGSHNIGVEADILIGEMDLTNLEMIILPGGLGGVASVRASREAMDALQFAWENDKFVAAICAGPTVLADLGITDGKNATCYPGCEDGMGSAIMGIKKTGRIYRHQFPGRKVAAIIKRPPTNQTFPANRWVLFQFSSLFNAQGTLMPMK